MATPDADLPNDVSLDPRLVAGVALALAAVLALAMGCSLWLLRSWKVDPAGGDVDQQTTDAKLLDAFARPRLQTAPQLERRDRRAAGRAPEPASRAAR